MASCVEAIKTAPKHVKSSLIRDCTFFSDLFIQIFKIFMILEQKKNAFSMSGIYPWPCNSE